LEKITVQGTVPQLLIFQTCGVIFLVVGIMVLEMIQMPPVDTPFIAVEILGTRLVVISFTNFTVTFTPYPPFITVVVGRVEAPYSGPRAYFLGNRPRKLTVEMKPDLLTFMPITSLNIKEREKWLTQ
jgi:hypothetical protein